MCGGYAWGNYVGVGVYEGGEGEGGTAVGVGALMRLNELNTPKGSSISLT